MQTERQKKHTASDTVKCHVQQYGDMEATVGGLPRRGGGEMDEHATLTQAEAFTLRVPHSPSSLSGQPHGHCSGARCPLKKRPHSCPPTPPCSQALGVKFEVPGSCGCDPGSRQGSGGRWGRHGWDPSRSPSLWRPRRPWWSPS